MRHGITWVGSALALILAAAPVSATSPVHVVMGPSRDGSFHDLQRKIDHLVGPGRVRVSSDYLGAHPGDPDPWFWVNSGTNAIAITLVDRKSPHAVIGWYEENGSVPIIDGVGDGVVLDDWRLKHLRAVVRIPRSVTRFGFYIEHTGGYESGDDGFSYRYFTNRFLNDTGPYGRGEEHAPLGGDVQMLIYDVSRWLGSNTWVVAAEYSDSGSKVGHGHGESDNDFSDIVFTVTGLGATPTMGMSFGRVKALFR